MKDFLKQLIKLDQRLKEPSSWVAIGGALAMFGFALPADLWQHIALIGANVAWVIGFFLPESASDTAPSQDSK